jgi:hypothetical protein
MRGGRQLDDLPDRYATQVLVGGSVGVVVDGPRFGVHPSGKERGDGRGERNGGDEANRSDEHRHDLLGDGLAARAAGPHIVAVGWSRSRSCPVAASLA